MATKTISFTLDVKSIDRAIKELQEYTRDFERKCQEIRERVAERIAWSAERGFSSAIASDVYRQVVGKGETQAASPVMANGIEVHCDHKDDVSVVWTDGEEAVFIEYGAGVHYNGNPGDSPHPWGLEQGFVIGGYGQGKGVNDAWGYRDSNGNILITHGTPAAMPMYHGAEEAIRALDEIIQEVFG